MQARLRQALSALSTQIEGALRDLKASLREALLLPRMDWSSGSSLARGEVGVRLHWVGGAQDSDIKINYCEPTYSM